MSSSPPAPTSAPIIPALLPEDAGLFQVHASRYREPDQLPAGAVLVVGSGASGAQIAEELARAGRRVYLSVGRHAACRAAIAAATSSGGSAEMGLDQTPVERRGPDRTLPLITGAYGGHTIDFRDFAAQGMTLARPGDGGARRHVGRWRPTSPTAWPFGDAAYAGFLDMVDDHVARRASTCRRSPRARSSSPTRPASPSRCGASIFAPPASARVVWATGYGCDFGWIDLPVLDAGGAPVHRAA